MTHNFQEEFIEAIEEVYTEAWKETLADLTPEEMEEVKNITLKEWAEAIIEVGLEIGNGFAEILRTGKLN